MAHVPTAVKLLKENGQVILTVTHSEKPSMNGKGSEETHSIVIEGPSGSVVTCYDDQLFRLDQNSVTIAKIGYGPITVPIAVDFVHGDLPEGIYRGRQPTYCWQLNKVVAENFFESLWGDIEAAASWLAGAMKWLAEHVEVGISVNEDPGDEEVALRSGLAGDANLNPVPSLPPGVVGYTPNKAVNHSTNNHVDNMSSIKLGDQPE
jgi:hypothetical protein